MSNDSAINTKIANAEEVVNTIPVVVNPLDLPVKSFSAGLKRRGENRNALIGWIREALVEGTDYGTIRFKNGTESKPSLKKPGAEKICGMLGLSVQFPNLQRYEEAAISGMTIKQIILRCELRDGNEQLITSGIGARSLTQDANDLNKALKMAAKSAQIDATLRCAGLSEVFTQDLEDMVHLQDKQQPNKISAAQKRRLEALIGDYHLDRERVKSYCTRRWNVIHFQDLACEQYRILDSKLPEFAEQLRHEQETQQDYMTPEVRKAKAEELRAKATQIKQAAQYADGRAYHDDMNQAHELESEAARLLA